MQNAGGTADCPSPHVGTFPPKHPLTGLTFIAQAFGPTAAAEARDEGEDSLRRLVRELEGDPR